LTATKALVVDDDAMNRELLRRMLVRMGWQVDDAKDGRAAIEAAAGTRYDVVFVDLLMPGLDGLGAARCLRDAYALEGHCPCLIAVTGSLCGIDESAVFDCVLPKPFVLDELTAAIEAASLSRAVRVREART